MAFVDRTVSSDELVKMFGIDVPQAEPGAAKSEQARQRDAIDSYLEQRNRHINANVSQVKSQLDTAMRSGAQRQELYSYATDAAGTTWGYLPLGADMASISSCKPGAGTTSLQIPESVDGRAVVRIETDACAQLAEITTIVCARSISQIDLAAFRRNPKLQRIVYPPAISTYDATWTRECPALEEVILPSLLRRIDSSLFDLAPNLKRLGLGSGLEEIVPGAFAKSQLESVWLDSSNPHFSTDGIALYTKDAATLVLMLRPVESYAPVPGTRTIASKAASGATWLTHLELPDSLERIEEYAFSRAGISELVCPPKLQRIEERAFYGARKLERVQLNEGLRYIGTSAFENTAVTRLELPASIENIGAQIISRKYMRFGDPQVGIKVSPDAHALTIDEDGGMYRTINGVTRFAAMLNTELTRYTVAPGTRSIEERAFRRHNKIEAVALPEGLESIGEGAFRDCPHLVQVVLPRSLRLIADEAFMNSALATIALGPAVERIGEKAILSRGSLHESEPITLKHIEVAPENPRFFAEGGLLCERLEGGEVKIIVFTDDEPVVHIGPEVTQIAPYAFSNARHIRELYLHDGLRRIGSNGLNMYSMLSLLHVELREPAEGQRVFDLRFPQTDRARHAIMLALGMPAFIDIETILKHYDDCITNMQGFDASRDTKVDIYTQAQLMLERLDRPVYMQKISRAMFDTAINEELLEICVAAARHDDRTMVNQLVAHGYITASNITSCIDAVGKLQDAAMTGYLLEVKRQKFGAGSVMDFDL